VIEARMADPAAYAQALVDEWHTRLKAGGSARPSPTIAVAQSAGYERLVVECSGCRQSKRIPWDAINRPPETLLADFAGRPGLATLRREWAAAKLSSASRTDGTRGSLTLRDLLEKLEGG
jgi:hypothetical protein